MKWVLILLLPITLSAQVYDTTYQMVYYQKNLITKHKFELYVYSSYDLWWEDESGIGINITLPNKRKKKKHKR